MGMEQQAELLPAAYLFFMLHQQAVLAIISSRWQKIQHRFAEFPSNATMEPPACSMCLEFDLGRRFANWHFWSVTGQAEASADVRLALSLPFL